MCDLLLEYFAKLINGYKFTEYEKMKGNFKGLYHLRLDGYLRLYLYYNENEKTYYVLNSIEHI